MSTAASRRDEYSQSTRRALLDAGLELFVSSGYTSVSAEQVVRTAGLTRGALYHHFDGGKRGLFEAVFEEQEAAASQKISDAIGSRTEVWERQLAAVDAFLDVCSEKNYREIVLLQGPAALGWERWRELDEQYLRGLVLDSISTLRTSGLIESHPDTLATAAIYGAITEVSLAVAHAPDPALAREQAAHLIRDLFSGIRTRY
ncbi:AcrR family transcriptional regulator [Rhodococcus sp. OAS809]|uniref:TetR/AcrR family transcriptional regulator n=1 Tax=Rhodococcus sp. OAS809 TaxID=2663874 RepID=UPI00178910EA